MKSNSLLNNLKRHLGQQRQFIRLFAGGICLANSPLLLISRTIDSHVQLCIRLDKIKTLVSLG
ncbi:hypothetical protein, partial [Spirosoma arboris]|uniref:hypothetical protein n=1 Tax=Spirosoma arboris TaxID=2682092 RepID=UPI001D106945